MPDINVLVLLGSLRAASINRQLAELGVESAPDGVRLQLFDRLAELPFYSEDVDTEQVVEPVIALRQAAAAVDAALIVTPENNGSIPAVLKNAIDWLSRPFGQSVLADKPVAVIGAAEGRSGGAQAHDDTRRSLNSFGLGLPKVVESITLSVPIRSLDGKHPRHNADVVANVRSVVARLAAEVA